MAVTARVTTRVTITASQAEVFRYLSDLHLHHLWNPHLISIKPLTILDNGTEYKTISSLLGVRVKAHNMVTKYSFNTELEITNETGALRYKVHYQVLLAEEKTILVCRTIVTAENNVFVLTLPILKQLAKRELRSDLNALKTAVEQQLT